jgi:hypothetical protein
MIKTCKDFQESNERLLEQAGSPRRNGHDLWLTSRRHGCGFWDRGYAKDIAEALIKEAHKLDEFSSLVKGDDGKIYLE